MSTSLRFLATMASAFLLLAAARAGAEPVPTATPVAAQPAASPTASAAPTASPRPLGFTLSGISAVTFVGQATAGGGQIAPEAPGFIAGAPLAPNSPYDLFSSAPQVPGYAGVAFIQPTLTYGFSRFDVGVTAALAATNGSTTNAAYWSENLSPALNPHLGSTVQPYAVVFPTHPGDDFGQARRLSILQANVATADGNLHVRGGWLDLTQSDRFVFAQPALTSVNPAIAYAPAESLTNGLAGTDTWLPLSTALPLHGVDLVAKRGTATFELTNAALPALPGEDARMTMGSVVLDRGEGTRFSAQLLHAQTSGLPFITTVPFGTSPAFVPYPQGVLPTSTLSGQRQTIAGLRGAFHLAPRLGVDAIVELGRAWYDASPVVRPGTERPGGFYHLGFTQSAGHGTASLDLYRMEPRYATMILPYGIPENQWSVSFAWPGQWLKSNYQLIDNGVLGVNRQGYRLRYYLDKGPLEAHVEYTELRQIEAETTASATQDGFIDGFYLPQAVDAATFGRQKRTALWLAWHARFGDVTLDLVDDTLYRPFVATHPEDVVSYEVPQGVLAFAKHLTPKLTGSIGIGRYAIKGAFAEPLDLRERLFFTGLQFQQTEKAQFLATLRRTAFGGRTTFPASPAAPDFTGATLVVEQRLRF